MDHCNGRDVAAVVVVRNCSLVLEVDTGMSWVVEGLSEKGLILEGMEPSLALEVEVALPQSCLLRHAEQTQDLCERQTDWVLALSNSSDYLDHARCCDRLVWEHRRETDLNDLRVLL